MSDSVVTRIAPSPTGHLHIGTARTALYNFIFAKKHGGKFIVRSEDTDRARSTEAFETEIREGLSWLNLAEDAFYRQSERTEIYKKYLDSLVAQDVAYISEEESKQHPGETVHVVRLRNPNKEITFTDCIRGDITFDTTELGDFVIARALDDALYHFTVVVDDFEMGVTHIIRGEDHISNTPRQILIQEAIGASRPIYAHLPLILAPDRSKMSKRHGAISLEEYKARGFIPSAVTNYLAFLGWNPGTDQEIFTLEELTNAFELTDIQKGGAVFDEEKFRWFNREHLKELPDASFMELVLAWLPEQVKSLPTFTDNRLTRLLPTIREHTEILSDITRAGEEGEYDFAFSTPEPTPEMLAWKKDADSRDALPRLQHVHTLLSDLPEESTAEDIKAALWPYAEEVGKGEVLWPFRVALTGRERSPDPFTVAAILGIQESTKRVKNACDTIEK